jgi:asparagine synthase (glutamine-hydrolysing)
VGVFLSGGIDSSLVAALAARNSSHPVQSFTLGFRNHPEYNELVYARRVANYLKADAHEVMIGPEEIREFFPRFLQLQEEPVMNPIWFANYFVSKLARDSGVIVVLSGDGGDELYAGYDRWMQYLRLYEGRAYRTLRAAPEPL